LTDPIGYVTNTVLDDDMAEVYLEMEDKYDFEEIPNDRIIPTFQRILMSSKQSLYNELLANFVSQQNPDFTVEHCLAVLSREIESPYGFADKCILR
jgi:hypothetical protein